MASYPTTLSYGFILLLRRRLRRDRINAGHLHLFKYEAGISLSDLYVYAPIIIVLLGIITPEVGGPALGSY